MNNVKQAMSSAGGAVDRMCGRLRPWQLLVCSCVTTYAGMRIYTLLTDSRLPLRKRVAGAFFRALRATPVIGTEIQKKLEETQSKLREHLFPLPDGYTYITRLPDEGWTQGAVIAELERYNALENVDYAGGKCSGSVYYLAEDTKRLYAYVFSNFFHSNPLHPDIWPNVRKIEAEVITMCLAMFNAGEGGSGTTTTGGTESILMACRAYRQLAYSKGIKYPQIVCAESAHAAFDKAADYFQMEITKVAVEQDSRKIDLKRLRCAITSRTCMIVVSAPGFPHGAVDDVIGACKIAQCYSGFLLPFMEKAGYPLKTFDFRVNGVYSISCDAHKFGFAPKGTSVILYKNAELRRWQYFTAPDWTGGVYATPTISGSRSGANVVATWAAMLYFGLNGYVDSTRKIVSTTRYIVEALRTMPEIKIYGDPEVCVVPIGSDTFDIFRLMEHMTEKGWNLNTLQFPNSIHLCCTYMHTYKGVADCFINDVKEAVATIMVNPGKPADGGAAFYGMAATIPDKSIVSQCAADYVDGMFRTDNAPPS